jgi:hypothetical protein
MTPFFPVRDVSERGMPPLSIGMPMEGARVPMAGPNSKSATAGVTRPKTSAKTATNFATCFSDLRGSQPFFGPLDPSVTAAIAFFQRTGTSCT